jgi:AraC family transcriptional regulator
VNSLPARTKNVEAEMPLGIGHVQIVRRRWSEPIEVVATAPTHYLELSLLPRSGHSSCCFPNDWGPNRFEPIGEMFLLPARHAVHTRSDCRQQNSIVCKFDPARIATWFDDELQWTDRRLRGSLNVVNEKIRRLLFQIGDELRNPGFASETMLELMARQVVLELCRHLLGIGERTVSGGLARWRLALIDERLGEGQAPPTLAELAALCNLSVRQLTRAFHASRGRSIGSYVAQHRIDHAKTLLASSMPIKAVAYTMGFKAPSNFTAAFQRVTGETPRQYRQRVQREEIKASVLVAPQLH